MVVVVLVVVVVVVVVAVVVLVLVLVLLAVAVVVSMVLVVVGRGSRSSPFGGRRWQYVSAIAQWHLQSLLWFYHYRSSQACPSNNRESTMRCPRLGF